MRPQVPGAHPSVHLTHARPQAAPPHRPGPSRPNGRGGRCPCPCPIPRARAALSARGRSAQRR
eukprot:3465631-Prymnesium_polylepis.1